MLSLHTNRRFPHLPIAALVVAILLVLTSAAPALADPRLVRVLWDVGGNALYAKAYARTDVGFNAFSVPDNAAAAVGLEFVRIGGQTEFLRKGDRVRLYVVNYNPVSHVWHETSAVEQVALETNLRG